MSESNELKKVVSVRHNMQKISFFKQEIKQETSLSKHHKKSILFSVIVHVTTTSACHLLQLIVPMILRISITRSFLILCFSFIVVQYSIPRRFEQRDPSRLAVGLANPTTL
jgi:hypothetical protein